jgi:hypothetical protein
MRGCFPAESPQLRAGGYHPMERAKRRELPAAVASRPVDWGTPLDDLAAETILDMVFDYDDGDPITGIRNAIIAGAAMWTIIAVGVFLLI